MTAETVSSAPAAGRRLAYFDCYSGASGNMILGALLDAGLDDGDLRHDLGLLDLSAYHLDIQRVVRSGISGTLVEVSVEDPHPRERTILDIRRIVQASGLAERVKSNALAVFERLAQVEARIHGTTVDAVHFHEVGAVDAIVDVVGAAAGLERLGVDGVAVSSLPLGHGSVKSLHGLLPLPAPATLALLADARAPTRPVDADSELVTPTGAAILTTLGAFGQPSMAIDTVGVGFGSRTFAWPNILRIWLGYEPVATLNRDEVVVLETNLDDCSPEQAAYAMERLLEAGALDVFFTPVQMKKNRPGVLVTVLARPSDSEMLASVVLRETTSLGVRFHRADRLICPRRTALVDTAFGSLQVKVKSIDGRELICPEYEECARVARERRVPIGDVYAAVLRAEIGVDGRR